MRRIALFIAGLALLTTAAGASTLDDVKARGKLVCGVNEGLPGFGDKDQKGVWHGFDVDFCRALAAATLGDPDKVDYVPLSTEERFRALTDKKIDVLSRNSTWTLSRDVGLGIEFAGISFHDGQGFLTRASYGVNIALELQGARICVITGTTTEDNAAAWFGGRKINVTFERFATRAEARKAYAEEKCDVFTADRSALAAERSLLAPPEDHVVLPEVISKEPLGPVTRQDDAAWADIVRWTLFGLIDAEEAGLTSASVTADPAPAIALGKPAVAPLHLTDDWLALAIGRVGNYGEIFERNLGEASPLGLKRGINALWTNGGILYAPPLQ